MGETPAPRPTREERMAKLAAARAATAARTDETTEVDADQHGTADATSGPTPSARVKRPRAASGARVVVGVASVAGFTFMTQAMGPLVAPAATEPTTPQPAADPTTQPSVVVRLVDENGNPIATDEAGTASSAAETVEPATEPVTTTGPPGEAGAADQPPATAPGAAATPLARRRARLPPVRPLLPSRRRLQRHRRPPLLQHPLLRFPPPRLQRRHP